MLDLPALYAECAPAIHPITAAAVVRVESGGQPFALNVNRLAGPQPRPRSLDEAVQIAEAYIATGYRVDLGLGQITDRNLPALGLTVRQVLDPCTNLRAMQAILVDGYRRAVRSHGEGQSALLVALSTYNTGNQRRGFENGYVARYTGQVVPALEHRTAASAQNRQPRTTRPFNPYTAETSVAWRLED